MRSRILAIIILIVFLIIPGIAYWYFFYKNVSTITFHPAFPGQEYEVILDGKLEYSYLPLADRVLTFRETCRDKCTVITPPAKYVLMITSTGMEDVRDTITIDLGVNQIYHISSNKKFDYTHVSASWSDPNLEDALLNNANTHFGGKYQHIGRSSSGEYLFLRESSGEYAIGKLSVEKFESVFELPFLPKSLSLDRSLQYVVIDHGDADRFISSIDGKDTTVFPLDGKINIIDYDHSFWKVQTDQGVYAYEVGRWKKNPRFTDYIDISDTLRIGYIDRKDTPLLELSNFPLNTSVLLLIDRRTGASRILRSGLDIIGFYHHEGVGPTILFPDGTLGYLRNITL